MKKIMKFSAEVDNSEIYTEAHKAKMSKRKLKKKAFVDVDEKEIKVKIKPKCSK